MFFRAYRRRALLEQYVAHRNRANLHVHAVTSAVAWLAITTALSQVALPAGGLLPLWLSNAGALWTVGSVLFWAPSNLAVAVMVLALTARWALLPGSPWGPGHGLLAGVVLPLAALGLSLVVARLSRVYHHEHAPFLEPDVPSQVRTAPLRAAFSGIFHLWLIELARGGWPAHLKAELDVEADRLVRLREQVPWLNWAKLASCRAAMISAPRTTRELAEAVREARRRELRIRVVASGFSWSSVACSDEALIFCERLDGIAIDRHAPGGPSVWVEAGVTNRQLNEELRRNDLCMPWNVVLETVRVAGIVSTGTHGTGKNSSTLGDLAEVFEVIDARGELRILSEATIGVEGMRAARAGLGLFGVIARVKLRVVPMQRVRQTDQRLPVREVLARLPELIRSHQAVELYWFPWNTDAWVRTIDPTDEPKTRAGNGFLFRAQNLFQNACAVLFLKHLSPAIPRLTPTLLRIAFRMLPFGSRVLDLPESHHYRHWIEMMPAGCLEVGFKIDEDARAVLRAWEETEKLVEAYAARGLYPLNISLNVRFIGSSAALLSPAYGPGTTCFIEIMWMGRPTGWSEFSSDLCRGWLCVPGALPHWSKEFEHVENVPALIRASLGERRTRFLSALEATGIDPDRAFWNPVVERVLLDPPRDEAVS